ncbi:MAG: transcription antitermination factor NusB [Candidatus Aminicenantaceae bacterium]
MGRRRKARESALQILFQLEFDDTQVEKTVAQYWRGKRPSEKIKDYSTWLVKGIITHQKKIDSIIQSISDHWRISRMALVDRNILRIAVFELLYEENISPAIIINEAIEIAKKYSSDEAASFVNGVLDAVRKKIRMKEGSLKDGKND